MNGTNKTVLIVAAIAVLAIIGKIAGPPDSQRGGRSTADLGRSSTSSETGSEAPPSECGSTGPLDGTVTVHLDRTKPNGTPWDAFGGLPDIAICVTPTGGTTRCYPSGSSASDVRQPVCQDSYDCTVSRVEIPSGSYTLTVIDVDAMNNDVVASSTCGAGTSGSFVSARVVVSGVPSTRTSAESGETPTSRAARTLVPLTLPGYRLAETLANSSGITVRYESAFGRPMPMIVLAVAYANGPATGRLPAGARRISVRGHRGSRSDADGTAILGWRSGPWGFVLTTRSDQGPGELHVVDAYAHGIAEHADQQAAIQFVRQTN